MRSNTIIIQNELNNIEIKHLLTISTILFWTSKHRVRFKYIFKCSEL